jgi:hypothetical protein
MKIEARRLLICSCLAVFCGFAGNAALAQKEVWTDPKDATLPAEFKIQGEYVGSTKDSKKLGVQVIALGKGAFQAVVYPGGLPGAGWDGANKTVLDGQLKDDGSADFAAATGKKTYLAQAPNEFSATSTFPPAGQKAARFVIRGEELQGQFTDAGEFKLKKTERKCETMGKQPPQGAIVLFDGKNTEHWTGGRLDEKTGLLNTDGKDILTKQKFNNYTMHLEFLLPYRPDARGQGRGNSGFYQVDLYEVQILDSFGLDGKNNECGGHPLGEQLCCVGLR